MNSNTSRRLEGAGDVGEQVELSDQEQYIFFSICMALIWLGLWLTAKMRSYGIVSLPESAVLLLVGVITQLILQALGSGSPLISAIDSMLTFNEDLFFFVLLPPIIFEAAYGLPRASFFGNIGLVCNLAFLGTFVTMILTGLICWSWSNLPGQNVYPMSFLNSMIFGAIVSATDPVAVLVAFAQLGMDPVIYAAVFGEAVLNDAVAIVFYQTLVGFIKPGDPQGSIAGSMETYGAAFGQFVLIFVGSTVLGCLFGATTCLFYKHVHMPESARRVEMALMFVIPYLSYFVAQAMYFSGIVTIMFCGIVVSKYGIPSFSAQCAEFVHSAYGAIAQGFEAFIFLYLGIAFGSFNDLDVKDLTFSLIAVVAVFVARVAHVIICVFLSNLMRSTPRAINIKGTAMLAFAGLRGPMAFALSVSAQQTLGEAGRVMNTATVIVVTVTTLLIGCLTPTIILKLDLTKTGSGSSGGWCGTPVIPVEDERGGSVGSDLVGIPRSNWFTRFEDYFIKPLLMKSSSTSAQVGIGEDVDTRIRSEDEPDDSNDEENGDLEYKIKPKDTAKRPENKEVSFAETAKSDFVIDDSDSFSDPENESILTRHETTTKTSASKRGAKS